MDGLDIGIMNSLKSVFTNCPWDTKSIAESIRTCFKDNEINPKEGYRNLYLAILGVEMGPRLAPILSELERAKVLLLLG